MRIRACNAAIAPLVVLAVLALSGSIGQAQTPKYFGPPEATTWAPAGCRTVPSTNAVLGPRNAWRNLHADAVNTDEISSSLAPMFSPDWVAEPNTFNPTGPVFDAEGNLYFSPLLPFEDVVLISVDPEDGSRRWSVAGTGGGAAAPMVLNDPENLGEQIVYLGLYDRALAVRANGSVVWDVPTGLVLPTDPNDVARAFGLNYHPMADAVIGLTSDGFIYVLARSTGTQLLAAPHALPGEQAPPADPNRVVPPGIVEAITDELRACMDIPPDFPGQGLVGTLLGGGTEAANQFSIDPGTGRLWVAATAPDAADGSLDGISELGALYGLDLVPNGPVFEIVEVCHRYFSGGSASTPALRVDGTRVYLGDAVGNLIALDTSCNDAWTLDIGAPLIASVGVSSDNQELYVPTRDDLIQVIDQGTYGVVGWTANLEVYDTPSGQENFNLNLVSIGANGIGFQAGAGTTFGANLPRRVGVGVLDRATGQPRYFADGLDETLAVMSTGPDGALYIGNSPFRRAITRALFPSTTPPLVCGIRKFTPQRLDLLMRDAVKAAADRAANAATNTGTCPDSALADITQIQVLIDQTRNFAPDAVARGEIEPERWDQVEALLEEAEANLTLAQLDAAAEQLQEAAEILEPPSAVPALSRPVLAILTVLIAMAGMVAARRLSTAKAG